MPDGRNDQMLNPHTISMLELMRLQVNALYICDDRSRLVSVNQWDGGVAPRFFLGRTVEGNLWRFRRDLPNELVVRLEKLCRDEPPFDDVQQMPRHHERYIELLAKHAPIEQRWSGPAYGLPDGHVPRVETVAITDRNAHMLREGFEDWLSDVPHRQPFVAVVEGGNAVSLCTSVRITEHAHEAGVETVSNFRRRGYARSAVAAWAALVRAEGAMPLYSASWTNKASQRVATALGGVRFGEDYHLT